MNHHGITPESLLNHPFREPKKGHAREALLRLPPAFTAPKACITFTLSRSPWAHCCITPPSFLYHPFWVSTTARRRKAFEGSLFLPKGTLFQDVALGWLDTYMATDSTNTWRLAPAATRAATPGRARRRGFRGWGGNSNPKRNLSPSESEGLRFPLRIQFWVFWRSTPREHLQRRQPG